MAIDLLNRFAVKQVNTTANVQSNAHAVSESAEAARIIRSVYALKAGDSLQGELISAKGNEISLLLGESVTLSARMDKELSLTPGQIMTFTVNANNHGKLSLTPLFANTGMEQNAMKALDAASIPVTDKTLAMAEELMKQGMPINKQTLNAVFRQMGMFPEANVSDLVMLNKMNIPVTSESLSMMRLYQTNEQYLFSDLQGLSTQMTEFLTDMVNSSQTDGMNAFVRGFIQIFAGNNFGTDGGVGNTQATVDGTGMNFIENLPVAGQGTNADAMLASVNGDDISNAMNGNTNSAVQGIVSQQEMQKTDTEVELMKLLSRESLQTQEGIEQLDKSLFAMLKEQLLMKPESMDSKEYVREFYERLDEQMGKLQDLIKSTGKENSTLSKEVSTVKSNIQFMNQINELYHYVQLPIKMNDGHTNGDLYVYKRKNSKTGEDGKLTALLHLSMPTLGNMDVFLSLEEGKLSTRFCLEKEEMIDFIEANIDRLNERLMKKGYQVQTAVTSGVKEDKTVIEHIMESELPIPVMTSQSFDARC